MFLPAALAAACARAPAPAPTIVIIALINIYALLQSQRLNFNIAVLNLV